MPSARAHPAAQLPAALLIDDHDDTREMYRLALSDAAFRVFEAGNGLDGAVCASDALPDVIVTELAMPCLDGFELIARLHHDETDFLRTDSKRLHGCTSEDCGTPSSAVGNAPAPLALPSRTRRGDASIVHVRSN